MNRTPVARLAFWISCTLLALAGLGAMSVAASTARTDRVQPPPNTSVYRIYLPLLVRVPLPTGCVAPPPNMAAWWPLDELVGPTAVDIAGFPTNGTHVNGPTPAPGMVAGGLSFDGVNDYVNVPDHPSLNFGQGNLSIDAWIKTSDTSGVKVIVDKRVEAASVPRLFALPGERRAGLPTRRRRGISDLRPGADVVMHQLVVRGPS